MANSNRSGVGNFWRPTKATRVCRADNGSARPTAQAARRLTDRSEPAPKLRIRSSLRSKFLPAIDSPKASRNLVCVKARRGVVVEPPHYLIRGDGRRIRSMQVDEENKAGMHEIRDKRRRQSKSP